MFNPDNDPDLDGDVEAMAAAMSDEELAQALRDVADVTKPVDGLMNKALFTETARRGWSRQQVIAVWAGMLQDV